MSDILEYGAPVGLAPRPVHPLSAAALLKSAVDRVLTARPELVGHLDVASPQALRAATAGIRETGAVASDEMLTVVVVSRLSLPQWVGDTCGFALGLAPATADAWRRSFTRTIYLAGRPDNLRERFTFDHVAEDGSVAWAGPAPAAGTATLRRLLKAFEAPRELAVGPPTTVTVPGRPRLSRPPAHRELYLATARVTLTDALVHINHLVAEAVMDGLVHPGDRLTLRFVPRLTGLGAQFASLRVDNDVHHPDELQAYAGLTTEI